LAAEWNLQSVTVIIMYGEQSTFYPPIYRWDVSI